MRDSGINCWPPERLAEDSSGNWWSRGVGSGRGVNKSEDPRVCVCGKEGQLIHFPVVYVEGAPFSCTGVDSGFLKQGVCLFWNGVCTGFWSESSWKVKGE